MTTRQSEPLTGIFGGSFNPIHCGHIALAKAMLGTAGLDDIWFMVSPQNPLKRQDDLLDDNLRLHMVKAALAGERRLTASDYEFRLPRPSYTWDTLQHLSHDYPDRRFALLIGSDNWQLFDRWYRHEDIIARHHVVIYPRMGSTVDETSLPEGVTLAHTPLLDISSTEIRRRIALGLPIDGMVPEVTRAETMRYYK